ncbi:hypothetical protein SCLCIDRAFT_266665 [Scleroderma citrinum Foug A]|uniref:Uncharacterized protein n=1 Tax=Scleroderma citrinum Foug A TaxID=1036808 RepID=A0A0C2Z2N6_9AGAM|nr:hypothetical protein SCLCIDRAFT_266665 [Scleroderma citrinum Foug A]
MLVMGIPCTENVYTGLDGATTSAKHAHLAYISRKNSVMRPLQVACLRVETCQTRQSSKCRWKTDVVACRPSYAELVSLHDDSVGSAFGATLYLYFPIIARIAGSKGRSEVGGARGTRYLPSPTALFSGNQVESYRNTGPEY